MFVEVKRHIRNCLILTVCCLPITSLADDSVHDVSLQTLIDDPSAFYNNRVSVRGYLGGGLNLRLFASKDHDQISQYYPSVEVFNPDMRDKSLKDYCGKNFAIVHGRLVKTPEAKFLKNQDAQPNDFIKYGFYWISNLERIMIFDEQNKPIQCWPEE